MHLCSENYSGRRSTSPHEILRSRRFVPGRSSRQRTRLCDRAARLLAAPRNVISYATRVPHAHAGSGDQVAATVTKRRWRLRFALRSCSPHAKNKKSVAKRFKLTATGKMVRRAPGFRHLLGAKSTKAKRHATRDKLVVPGHAAALRQCLPLAVSVVLADEPHLLCARLGRMLSRVIFSRSSRSSHHVQHLGWRRTEGA